MIKIEKIKFRNILNSAGNIALEVEITTDKNISENASIPSEIIQGKREIFATNNIKNRDLNELLKKICNTEIQDQKMFDSILNEYIDELGVNICLSLSLAFARVSAKNEQNSLVRYICKQANHKMKRKSPTPLVAIFSGGVHNKKDSIQNIMLCVDIHPFSNAVKAIVEIYTDIESQLKEQNVLKGYGNSSGMIVEKMTTNEKIDVIENTIKKLNYEKDVSIAIDVAAEHFYENGNYVYEGELIKPEQLNETLREYVQNHNITYVEDPFHFRDEKWWKIFKQENPNILVVGDDLFATQDKYIDSRLANGIVIKMNQVGTLTGSINAFQKARSEKMITCVSHRSIETEDTFMCDLAVALNAEYIKIGGPRRGDRVAKYNQLLRLEEKIDESCDIWE